VLIFDALPVPEGIGKNHVAKFLSYLVSHGRCGSHFPRKDSMDEGGTCGVSCTVDCFVSDILLFCSTLHALNSPTYLYLCFQPYLAKSLFPAVFHSQEEKTNNLWSLSSLPIGNSSLLNQKHNNETTKMHHHCSSFHSLTLLLTHPMLPLLIQYYLVAYN
jgi:hypothetical protein